MELKYPRKKEIQEQRLCGRLFKRSHRARCRPAGWELDKFLTMTLEAMKATEDEINEKVMAV